MPVSIDPDQQKNEETTKLRHITPVISERWQDVDKVLMEYYFTDGRISVDEYNMAHRGKPKKADYLLLYRDNIPLAIVEAKAIDHSADEGYSQAVEYANILDVPFAYATNGDDLIEKDILQKTAKHMKGCGTAQAAIYLRRPPNPKLHTIMISRHKHLLIMKNAPLSCRA